MHPTDEAPAPDLKHTKRVKQTLRIDRMPPHSIEAEQGILGCILLSPAECMNDCVTLLRPGQDVFYDLRHSTLYAALLDMQRESSHIDLITLQEILKKRGQLEGVGGLGYLSTLPDAVPSAANLAYYIGIVIEKYRLRRLATSCQNIAARVYDAKEEPAALFTAAESEMLEVSKLGHEEKHADMKGLVNAAITRIEEAVNSGGIFRGLRTGLSDLDRYFRGMRPGQMIVIAARPSFGKTTLAMNIAEYNAINEKIPVGVFSLEMTDDELTDRMICSQAQVSMTSVEDGRLHDSDYPKLTAAAGRVANSKIYIDDAPGQNIEQIRSKARQMAIKYGIKLFIIDYLQLVQSHRRRDNRQQELTDVSNGIKSMAKELGVPVVVLSQLNRELEKHDRSPIMSDLKECGAIEQDADKVFFLYKESGRDMTEQELERNGSLTKGLLAKNRGGPTGEIELMFLKAITRFEQVTRMVQPDL